MSRLNSIAAALAALVLPCAALAEKEAPPPPGTPKDFKLPAPRHFTFENGAQLTLVEYGAVPKAYVLLRVDAGNIDEGPHQTWLADLTGDLLLEGTTTRSARQISEAAAGMGGSLRATTWLDGTDVGADVLGESAAEMVRLVADLARNPRFDDAAVARKRTDYLRNLAVTRSQPGSLAQEKFLATVYPDHPYGHLLPSAEELAGYTTEQIRAFHARTFGAARAHLRVVGRFDAAAVEKAAREALGDWNRGSPATVIPPKPRAERSLQLVDRPGAVQSTIYLGLPVLDASSPDWVAQEVMNALLGGSFGSRVTANIREKHGYTYSPRSNVSWQRRSAYWVQVADVTTKDTGASLKEIFFEIDRLSKEPPSAEELKGIQNYLAGVFVVQNSSRWGIAGKLSFVGLQGLGDDYLATYVQHVHAVTPQDVQRLAAQLLKPEAITVVVVGDLATVREQVASYGNSKTGDDK
jgi:zinc protease